jgi:hypothetical protein
MQGPRLPATPPTLPRTRPNPVGVFVIVIVAVAELAGARNTDLVHGHDHDHEDVGWRGGVVGVGGCGLQPLASSLTKVRPRLPRACFSASWPPFTNFLS